MRFSSFALVASFAGVFVAAVTAGACTATQTTIPLDFGDAGSSTNPTDPKGSSGGTSGTSGGSSGGTAGTTCEKICEKAASAKCSAQSTCVADCEADQKKIPAGCKAEADAVQECASKASTFECNSKGKPVVKGACDTEGNALVQCVLGGGKPDAGPKDCGTLKTGDATCDSCMESKCCSQLAACSADAACLDLLDCYGTCNDNACYAKCDADHPGGVPESKLVFSCMSGSCSAQCN